MTADTSLPPRPLDSLRILVPRGGAWGEGIAERIRARGGIPTVAPLVRIEPPEHPDELAAAVARWNSGAFDWLVVTSANAVTALVEAGIQRRPSRGAMSRARTAAVGPATEQALRDASIEVDLAPSRDFSAAGLAVALLEELGDDPVRVLLPLSDLAGHAIEQTLQQAGHTTERVTAYRTVTALPDIAVTHAAHEGLFDAILVTSGSAASAIAAGLAPLPETTRLVAIGPPSAAALEKAGLQAHVVASSHTVDGLLDAAAGLSPDPEPPRVAVAPNTSVFRESRPMTHRFSVGSRRPRRLRSTAAMRRLVAETRLHPADLVLPVFVREGLSEPQPIVSMPGVQQHTLDSLRRAATEAAEAGLGGVMLFGVPVQRDSRGSGADDPNGILNLATAAVAAEVGDALVVQTDLCLDEFTDHGHCGVIDDAGRVDNDETLERYRAMALAQAEAGSQLLGLSGMMDGQVAAVRDALDAGGFEDTAILAYAAKYASAFYGPFREAVDSQLSGDRKTYQQDPANRREGGLEAALDLEEGADVLMVKPAMSYLDVLADVAAESPVPVWAYQVSGEAAMIEAAAANGWIDRQRVIQESLVSIRRAGADAVLSYFAMEVARWAE